MGFEIWLVEMKVIGNLILHTGRPYLRYAIEALKGQVDHIMIFYSEKPSQGFQTDIPCPDTRAELIAEVEAVDGPPVTWVDGSWANETEHVNAINAYTKGYDWIWRVDADEIAPTGMVVEMIGKANAQENHFREFRVPFVHAWRTFNRACRDASHPIRLTRVNGGLGIRTLDSDGGKWEVWHGGYAQPTRYIEYKMGVSGHKAEWRPEWFKERWLANAQRDVHPVMHPTHWMTEDYDLEKLPAVLRKHPYFGKAVIE